MTPATAGTPAHRPSWRTHLALLALAALVALAGCLGNPLDDADDETADLALVDGTVWTGTGDTAEALAVRDGEIAAVGTSEQIREQAGPEARVVDLDGSFVAPGFADAHAHLLEGALDPNAPADGSQFEPTWRPYDDQAGPPGSTVNFGGQVGSGVYDRLARASGQEDTSPATYDNCTAPGEVTQAMRERVLAAEDELASQGLTTVVEAGTRNLTHLAVLRELASEDELDLRWQIRVVSGCLEHLDEAELVGSPEDKVRVFGLKLYADGYLGSRVAALREDYADREGWRGVLYYGPDSFSEDLQRARAANLTVATHAIGDRSAEFVLDRYEEAGVQPSDRWTIEHAQVLDDELMGRMAGLGVIASYQLSFHTADMNFAEDRLGEERMDGAYAWGTLAERDVPLAGGSDWPIEVVTPAWGIARTVTRQELNGTPGGGWYPEERLTIDETLASITQGVAHLTREEDTRGTIEEGKAADLTVLRENPFEIPALEIANATVEMTIVDGEVAFEGSQSYPPPVDADGSVDWAPGRAPGPAPPLGDG